MWQREEAGGQKEKGSRIAGEVCDSVTHSIQFINLLCELPNDSLGRLFNKVS